MIAFIRFVRSLAFVTLSLLSACSTSYIARTPILPPPQSLIAAPIDPQAVSFHRVILGEHEADMIGTVQVTRADYEDTFTDIARRFNLGYEELVRSNPGVDPWLPGAGRQIILPSLHVLPDAPREGVVINVAAMRLYYFPKQVVGEAKIVYTFPIGIGRVGFATPEGFTKITRKAKNPNWVPGPDVRAEHKRDGEILPAVVKPGPDNPLGTRAIYLDWPSYLIHGTNKPSGVGLRSSHGCIRLFPEDIELLYELVKSGDKVSVVNQPFVFGWQNGELYLQAFDVLEDDLRDWQKASKKLISKALSIRMQKRLKETKRVLNWDEVVRLSHDSLGLPVQITSSDASIKSLIVSAPRVRNALPIGANWDGK